MKKLLTTLLLVAMIVTLLVPCALAAGEYEGKTVVVYTGNLKGDVDVFARAAAVKDYYANKGANVLLVDAGNYLHGTAAANADRGLTVYNLMDAAGYAAAGMGPREFYFGNAATGQIWHGNLTYYYTQKDLLRGAEERTYGKNGAGTITGTLAAKAPAIFDVLATNITINSVGYYDFDATKTYTVGDQSVGVYALSDTTVGDRLQDNFVAGYSFADPAETNTATLSAMSGCDITICLNSSGTDVSGATLTIAAPEDGEQVFGVAVIDNATKAVTNESIPDVTPKASVQAIADQAKTTADPSKVADSTVTFVGADRIGWKEETNLGDLVADALKWYAENRFDGFANDVPVVAIQNGGNCDMYMYDGEVTSTDLLYALPFSPRGVTLMYVKGSDLVEALEAASWNINAEGTATCPGFAQVAGMEYEIHTYKEYQAGEAYGKYYKCEEPTRIVIKTVNGEPFDPEATYALITDTMLSTGMDTYYMLAALRGDSNTKFIDNGNGVLTRDIVALYIDKVLKGKLGDQYAEPQGRIKIVTEDPSHAITVTNGTADLEKAAPGETVTLKADDPAPGEVFDKWVVTEGDVTIKDPAAAETSFVMGDADVKVEATYKCDGGDNCPSKDFTDVDRSESSWSHQAIDWAVVNKVTNGMDPTHFGPTNACTRAQAVTFLWRAMGEPEPTTTANPFKDVSADAYYYKAVLWAAEKEITNGVTADTFAPDATCTRGQIVTFLWRAEGKVAPSAAATFTDVPADAYFADAVAWAVENGITNGTSPTTFAPNDNCTRAHIVTFLYRDLA